MKKGEREESYLETMIDYQDKRSLEGYYIGGRLDPMYKAKTKAGGYLLLLEGILAILVMSVFLYAKPDLENSVIAVMVLIGAVLSIIVGIKFLKLNAK